MQYTSLPSTSGGRSLYGVPLASRRVDQYAWLVVILRPEPVFDAAKAEVGSRLKIVTNVSNNDKNFVRIVFKVIPPFVKEKQAE